MNFENFISDIKRNKWNVHGVEVYEKGVLTYSFGDTCDTIYDIYSAAKTILSIAAGIAMDRGLMDPGDSVIRYLPENKIEIMPDFQRKKFEKISIHRLLTMSVDGFPFRPEGSNYLDFCLSCSIPDPDTKTFHYNNISAYLVSAALYSALQEDVGEFIVRNIFVPLHIEKYEYGRSPEGLFYGASNMKLTVNELSRIGLLLYNRGVYEGKRILSEKYVETATSVQQMNREGGYGYFIWKYRDGFSISGKWKQKCYCLPEQEIMVTFLSHIEDDSHGLLVSMEKNILGI